MKYDMKIHLPQQMENMMQAFASGDAAALERTKENIKEIIIDETFQKDIAEYEKKREETIEDIQTEAFNNALECVANAQEQKNLGAMLDGINEMFKGINEEISTVDGKFWDNIKTYITGWVSQLDVGEKIG